MVKASGETIKMAHATYIGYDVHTEMRHVGYDLPFVAGDLRMLNQLGQVLLGDAILRDDVQQDDPDFVACRHVLVEQHRHDVSHLILDLLAFGIRAHGQILGGKRLN